MIRQTYAEVMEEVANISWAVMDSEQHAIVAVKLKKRIGQETSDGVKLTWAIYGRALGASAKALESAAQRAQKGSAAPDWKLDRGARAARQIAREHPEEILKDPVARKAVIAAATQAAPDEVIHAVSKATGATRTAAPATNIDDIYGPFNRVRNALSALARILPDFVPGQDFVEEAEDTIAELEGTADLIRGWIKGRDIGTEAEDFLKEVSS